MKTILIIAGLLLTGCNADTDRVMTTEDYVTCIDSFTDNEMKDINISDLAEVDNLFLRAEANCQPKECNMYAFEGDTHLELNDEDNSFYIVTESDLEYLADEYHIDLLVGEQVYGYCGE